MADYGTLLREQVTLKCRSIDRIFLQAYVPKLQSVGQVCTFLRWRRKYKIPSSAAFGKIGDEFVRAVHEFAKRHEIPVVHFEKGQNKEQLARPYIEAAAREGKEQVVPDRDRARKGVGLALVESEGARESGAPAHGMGPANGLRQPLLFLSLGLRVWSRFLEDKLICAVSDLDLSQRT
jgi:hypothetical protein